MAPSRIDGAVDPANDPANDRASDHSNDAAVDPTPGVHPLEHLRRAAAAPIPGWLTRTAALLDEARTGGISRFLIAAVVAAMLVAGVAVYALWQSSGAPTTRGPEVDAAASLPRASTGSSTGTTPAGTGSDPTGPAAGPTTGPVGVVVAQASGAVVRPGVYRMAAGSRVGDLVEQAGGAAPDADLDRVNLAAPLADGVRVWVPRRGETDPPAEVATTGGTTDRPGPSGPAPLVDLNTATAGELDGLPGVGPATAAAIIDHRQRNGPFATVEELADVRGIGDAKLEQLRDLVRV